MPPTKITPPTIGPDAVPPSFLERLGVIESSNRPYIRARTSSASGLYQFTKATWQRMGGKWGTDETKAFGGLRPSVAEQTMRAAMLTAESIGALSAAGIATTNPALYAAHFLGVSRAKKVLTSAPSAMIRDLVPPSVIAANPFLEPMTVATFKRWLDGKMNG